MSVPVGITVAVVTALLTCVVAYVLIGRYAPPPPPAPAPLPQPTLTPTPDAGPDAEVDAADAGEDGLGDGAADVTIAAETPASSAGDVPTAAALAAGAAPAERYETGNPDCALPDKDIAREAWRHNVPTICRSAEGHKASLFVPVKGSIDDATYGVRRKPAREARIDLPEAESLLTMAQYKLDRDGFVDLRPSESDSGGTLLRIRLQSRAGDPTFEIKEGYVKITVVSPAR